MWHSQVQECVAMVKTLRGFENLTVEVKATELNLVILTHCKTKLGLLVYSCLCNTEQQKTHVEEDSLISKTALQRIDLRNYFGFRVNI